MKFDTSYFDSKNNRVILRNGARVRGVVNEIRDRACGVIEVFGVRSCGVIDIFCSVG